MTAREGIFGALARRFTVNQFLTLAGCVLLLFSMAFDFTTHRFMDFSETVPIVSTVPDDSHLHSEIIPYLDSIRIPTTQVSTVTGFSMVFISDSWGFTIIRRNVFELLLPILAVVVTTVVGTKNANGKLIALIVSAVGLCFGLSILISTFGHMSTAEVGLQAFVGLWIGITVLAFLEYKDMHPLESGQRRGLNFTSQRSDI